MECLVRILLWSSVLTWTRVSSQSGRGKEVFFVNLEEGFFGCQVNETAEVLQIFKINKLCDGVSDCFRGSDENSKELKCSNNCLYTTGHRCINGACLDSQCHCNDGWGGKGCSMPDDNECKYRPCDVFAHCTNNIGSYDCTCFPGYEGDGHNCQDIDECQIPELSRKCVENAECCNLPAEYVCKCKPGFEGDGQVECRDIDECRESKACGANSLCHNYAGNYTCSCQEGYAGDPYTGCVDLNECLSNPCGSGAKCINQYGGYLCECPPGAKGDPYTGCGVLDLCQSSPCGLNARCHSEGGTYRCECPQGFEGNPRQQCLDVDECLRNPCGRNAVCSNTEGSYQCSCQQGLTGDPFTACSDTDECSAQANVCGANAICKNTNPGFRCECPPGFSGNANTACEATEVRTLCKSNFDCTNNAVCQNGECLCRQGFTAAGTLCLDVDECRTSPGICGPNAVCQNTLGSYSCACPPSFVGSPPAVGCSEPCQGVTCSQHAYCKAEEKDAYCVCEDGWTYDPQNIAAGCIDVNECGAPGTCGENAICTNLPGSHVCQCKPGYTGNPLVRCVDIDECRAVSTCGFGISCQNLPGSFKCGCPADSVPDPSNPLACISVKTCQRNSDCPGNAFCSAGKFCVCPEPNQGAKCESPCANIFCAANSQCTLVNGEPKCMCHQGYQPAGAGKTGCIDINECLGQPCGTGAFCENTPGGFRCKCPSGSSGDPNVACEGKTEKTQCSAAKPCPRGELCSQGKCVCQRGFQREGNGVCRDVDECTLSEDPACGANAFCKNLPGSFDCECPPGFNGNPFVKCTTCNGPDCGCQPPYTQDGGQCVLATCKNKGDCSKGAECITIAGGVSYCACPAGFNVNPDGTCEDINECLSTSRACGFGALCENKIGSFSCVCPIGTTGDPYSGVCSANQAQCSRDNDCRPNEKCVEPGQCICPPPFFSDTEDGGKCKSPCERFMCGINADCSPTDPPQCLCKTGYTGDAIHGCQDVDECSQNPCGPGARCLNDRGSYKCQCPRGTRGDPYVQGCKGTPASKECSQDSDCPGLLSCQASTCINPCSSLPCGENAVCIPEDHAAWCRCQVGYKENSEGKCTSMCDGVICGLNAQCIISDSGPTCACSQGTFGNPFPGGSCLPETCSPAVPCPEPLSCVSGKCRERCDSFSCGLNAACDSKTSKCFCREGFVGDGNFLCMPPILPPLCTPGCGVNSHCAYGLPNQCNCNDGMAGNPYEGCSESKVDITIAECKCGSNAECVPGGAGVRVCECKSGFTGNPFVGCQDINECSSNICGKNSVCINTIGSYDCRCQPEYKGNPFEECFPEQPLVADLCTNKPCGPNAVCSVGQCLCLPGFKGDAEDPRKGCQSSTCSNNLDCGYNEICQSVKGQYRCVDACSNVQCGPNSRCVTDNHHSTCICIDGFSGNPSDFAAGCLPEYGCKTQKDCPKGTVCSINISGKKSCVDPCRIMSCGKYETCSVQNNRPICQCSPSHVRNPITSECEIASVPSCSTDAQCSADQVCRPDSLNILRCAPICQLFTCPPNSQCRASNHQGFCQCFDGYTGNPNDRTGCSLVPKDQCSSDTQCSEEEVCSKTLRKCVPACNNIICGPQAVCITQNHSPKCTCPPGKFKGDPTDPIQGCKAVSCLTNKDCPPTKFCDRLSFNCMDVCTADTCGRNAVCLPENQRPKCSCPPGTRPNPLPEVACAPVDACSKAPCHSSARCTSTATGHTCSCPRGHVGDPYKAGCFPEGSCPNGDKDCPDKSLCINGKCKNICYDSCGPNTECTINNRAAQCQCLQGFIPSPLDVRTCIRDSQGCRADADCTGGSTCQGGQCRISCRSQNDCLIGEQCSESMCMISCISSQQCPSGQVCSNGVCSIGCRSNSNCPTNEVCISFKCVNPCSQEGACGPNALCKIINKNVQCSCPPRFAGVPTPQQGCVRIPSRCPGGSCPPQHACKGGMCHWQCDINADCAKGEKCLDDVCVKVCHSDKNCLQGEICLDSTCQPGCNKEEDCRPGEICQGGNCVCAVGFISTPHGCKDINECDNQVCHSSSTCTNTAGSFKCTCPRGEVGDPYTEGCKSPNECRTNRDCLDTFACAGDGSGYRKCVNPCDRANCGPNSHCLVKKHKAYCQCDEKHVGNPSSPLGCTKVECQANQDCSGDKVCQLINNRCIDACSVTNCGRGTCSAVNHVPQCDCEPGYIFSNNRCVDIDECQNSPCAPTAVCINTVGAYQCQCPPGTVADTSGQCRSSDQCLADSDCPRTAVCNNGKCQNPCEIPGSCGADAICTPANHRPMCSCPPRTNGNPQVRCLPLECVSNSDCASERTCVRNKCVDVCSLPNVCGQNTDCRATNHVARCFCLPGFTGEPTLGCTQLQLCTVEEQCPAGMLCSFGICSPPCQSSRDCLDNQLCNGGSCISKCTDDSQCPPLHSCQSGGVCILESRCSNDQECGQEDTCVGRENGLFECENVCSGPVICGRNAKCSARGHKAICTCPEGFFGDANDEKIGCQKKQCLVNGDCIGESICKNFICTQPPVTGTCTNDRNCQVNEVCDKGQCRDPCSKEGTCGLNAFCNVVRHKKQCVCPADFTGNPEVECVRIPSTCYSSSDCPQPMQCADGICMPPCNTDENCAINERCLQGLCMLTCRVDNDCFLGHVCLNKMCIVGCRANSDCPESNTCINNRCTDPCVGDSCGPNAKCQVVNHRAQCSCPASFIPNPTPVVGCVKQPKSCSANTQCPERQVCDGKFCKDVCFNDKTCLVNEVCDNGICKPLCRRDEDCNSQEICKGVTCVLGCRSSSNCPADLACINSQCSNPCDSPNTCGPNALCSVSGHRAVCSCPQGLTGDPKRGCRHPLQTCSSPIQCPKGYKCVGGICAATCSSSNDNCLLNEVCVKGSCRPLCNSAGDCSDGYICKDRFCVAGCSSDSQCQPGEACINSQCSNPCLTSSCGECAECSVTNHQAFCSCPASTTGNPSQGCLPITYSCRKSSDCQRGDKCTDGVCVKPCSSPSQCSCGETCVSGGCRQECTNQLPCPQGHLCKGGTCLPGCTRDNDCNSKENCVAGQCQDACSTAGCAPTAECRVANHRPVCLCPQGLQGNPKTECRKVECVRNQDCETAKSCQDGSCVNLCLLPNACGINAQCKSIRHRKQCACPPNYVGNPSVECIPDKNECLGNPCGANAICQDLVGGYDCKCQAGCTGDPFSGCICGGGLIDPCSNARCGLDALCIVEGITALCQCPAGKPNGDPLVECTSEKEGKCKSDFDCPSSLACVRGKCTDPCSLRAACGDNAICKVVIHKPRCECPQCFIGRPHVRCRPDPSCNRPLKPVVQEPPTGCQSNRDCSEDTACNTQNGQCFNPCAAQSCAFNKQCKVVNHKPKCGCKYSLVINQQGQLTCPDRQVECRVHNDCPSNQACSSGRCKNPCDNGAFCGSGKECQVLDHKAVCICTTGCNPSVQICFKDKGCPSSQACIKYKCQDPCAGTQCPGNTPCVVEDHKALCKFCPPGFTTDANYGCVQGVGCRANSECPAKQACQNSKCVNPCVIGACGQNQNCHVSNHLAKCINVPTCECETLGCPRGQSCIHCQCQRDPEGVECEARQFVDDNGECQPRQDEECLINSDCPEDEYCDRFSRKCLPVCSSQFCGSNTDCSFSNHNPICSCKPGFNGDPDVGCSLIQQPTNPCVPSPCGVGAICELDNGNPICSCPRGKTGNPFVRCIPDGERCRGNQCGPNSGCRMIADRPVCYCLPRFEGNPPAIPCMKPMKQCKPNPCGANTECVVVNNIQRCTCAPGFTEAVNTIQGCVPINEPIIVSLCEPGPCGANAECLITNGGNEDCRCHPGFRGDPFKGCVPQNPCNPSPCGPNTECNEDRSGEVVCSCRRGFQGDPISSEGCRAECLQNTDCSARMACIAQKCIDPCPGTCGVFAVCEVQNHNPICSCPPGTIGDPFSRCTQKPIIVEPPPPVDPCNPSPCGSNAECRVSAGQAICSCVRDYQGNPLVACKPECLLNYDCPGDKACISTKCVDPCPGTCGINADCSVTNHNAICTCHSGYTGDPFSQCSAIPEVIRPTEPIDPCQPSPCGPNANCREQDGRPVCTCLRGYFGAPPACRPECVINSECAPSLACVNLRCQNPCVGVCGINAKCDVVNHNPICSCPEGYIGDPFSSCRRKPDEERPVNPKPDVCNPNPCGPSATAKSARGRCTCTCPSGLFGDPYKGCRPECVLNSDCPRKMACSENKCVDPCPGTCGINAKCRVFNHIPTCTCPPGYIGNAFEECSKIPEEELLEDEETDPCAGNFCGAFSSQQVANGNCICSCLPGYFGTAPHCRPECVLSSDCAQDKTCLNQKCQDPCPGRCGINARCHVIRHHPICTCPPNYQGDPFQDCQKIPPKIEPPSRPKDPCVPSPCGPNSVCKRLGERPMCSCTSGNIGAPPSCRPECIINNECKRKQACSQQRCVDPCTGACGLNAKCTVRNHLAVCKCPKGFNGDPFRQCNKIPEVVKPVDPSPVDPCEPSPCGANTNCRSVRRRASCSCIPGYFGDPYTTCRPECISNSDCPANRACSNLKCIDPCPGTCGIDARCQVINHIATCTCNTGFRGDPFNQCVKIPTEPVIQEPSDPCNPDPCGPNSDCRPEGPRPVCNCLPGFFGGPPNCRPECLLSSECQLSQACVQQKCVDPCPRTCGANAECKVVNHNPICSCPKGYSGDPFFNCNKDPEIVRPPAPHIPCVPDPCGPNSICREVNGHEACSCRAGYIGTAPNCRPECVLNAECPSNKACIQQKCSDPCVGACGYNARCTAVNHNAICTCPSGYRGDPFSGCTLIPEVIKPVEPVDPCNPSPCGANAECSSRNRAGSCRCIPDYIGDPYVGCRPECLINTECPNHLACMQKKCADPCPGTCGRNAQCSVRNHNPICTCNSGYEGDPISACTLIPPAPVVVDTDPCDPNPCGPNSQHREINGVCVCSCLPAYQGTPPACRPECVVSSDCNHLTACINQKCVDPCPGVCGNNARCQVTNHNPVCQCPPGFTGDPFSQCTKVVVTRPPPRPVPVNPCSPTPCGPFSTCRESNQVAACACQPNYIGVPPNCRPECSINAECPSNKACLNEKCIDPCPGSCGPNAECVVQNHQPICRCPAGYTGDPFRDCRRIVITTTTVRSTEVIDPCNPTPCGANAQCRSRQRAGACSCIAGYFGDPYLACRPECVLNTDCPSERACVNNKCVDPCPGVCGINAICNTVRHMPICTCLNGYTGDAITQCTLVPHGEPVVEETDPCDPNPCGAYSQHKEQNGVCVCSCEVAMIGAPPNCRPECLVSSECSQTTACMQQRCRDPCPGLCGANAECRVTNHNPICTCRRGYEGDPFSGCSRIPPPKPIEPVVTDPCEGDPCGRYAQCRNMEGVAACSCLPGYVGTPPNCRPECVIHSECPSNKACINEKCRDPCPGACGAYAECSVIQHNAVCRCQHGYEGDAFSACRRITTTPPPPRDPCNPNPCGANADPSVRGTSCQCTCRPEYFGDPYAGCRPECVVNSDCDRTLACGRNNKCYDPCPGTCGYNAVCKVINHNPTCTCLPRYVGDPFTGCSLEPEATISDPCEPNPCGRGALPPRQVGSGPNAECACECPPLYNGDPYIECKPECVVNSDCPLDKACRNFQCYDPCPGVCGRNAQCDVRNHSPVCSCLPGYQGNALIECVRPPPPDPTPVDPCNPNPCGQNAIARPAGKICQCTCPPGLQGDPFVQCRPECTIDQDCPRTLACISQKCKDPCIYDNQCGINALCEVRNHRSTCICPPGYEGDAYQICTPIREPIKPECTSDPECPLHLACIGQKCRDPCIPEREQCGVQAVCRVNNHRATCICPSPLEGNPYTACILPGCNSDLECPLTDKCIDRACVNACSLTQCGIAARCEARDHRARCLCPDGWRGDPYIECDNPECVVDEECPQVLACRNEKCVDPCDCAVNANCIVRSHRARCQCIPNHQGDPYTAGCFPIPVIEPECRVDGDCPSRQACLQEVCRNPCIELKPCGRNAECSVQNTLPQRTMVCMCIPGYVGDADVYCELPPAPEPGCTSNSQCGDKEICRDRSCINPCVAANPCAPNAVCSVRAHTVSCNCPSGFTGDSFSNCYPIQPRPECTADSECPMDEACINEHCINPCIVENPCAPQAQCTARVHHPVCTCPEGYGGDPYRQCYRPECRVDNDCPLDKACVNENCLNPCLNTDRPCGRGAECLVENHKARCICAVGLQGNPLIACINVECRTDNDCPTDQACDYTSQTCNPVCGSDTCAEGASCRGINHQPQCSCLPPSRGNGHVACIIPPEAIEAECRVDDDCAPFLACINAECQDPCQINRPCHHTQTCKVENSSPIRTVICICPEDSFIGPNGECKPKVTPVASCAVDRDCGDPDKCVDGTCRDACNVDPCGANAICKSRLHASSCTCPIGYTGNPQVQCVKITPDIVPVLAPECADNSECPPWNACINRQCLNPCAVTDPCATNAFCKVQEHEPICTCPEGYFGDPRVSCTKPVVVVGCQTNDDCPQTEACNNRDCVDPCNCGTNAQCYVNNHKPVCYCPVGFTGNPEVGCVPVGCSSDSECENTEICTNRQCLDACVANNPCASNAQCYSTNHQAACRCPPGLEGDPYVQCVRVECRINQDCSENSACISARCVNPCLYENPCAPQATCSVQNHIAKCQCPPGWVGNPLVSCSPKQEPDLVHPEPECYVDGDCPDNTACLNERCENPCLSLSPCDVSAICTVVNSLPFRTMICSCREGWVPDTQTRCKPVELPNPPGCARDDDCPNGEACVNRQCVDPCDCGSGASCFIENHRPICVCPPGFIGDPQIACEPVGCQSDNECRDQETCVDGNCVNPCLIQDPCGRNAECYPSRHRAMCECKPGYEGDPFIACEVIGCRRDQECPQDKACRSKDCINPCLYENPCAQNAECLVADHKAQCRCPIGFTGNAYVNCIPLPTPECVEDKDCPSGYGCLSEKCKDLCLNLNPCNDPAICTVIDSLPVRTMVCTCPDGYVSTDDNSCRTLPPILSGCSTDDECGETDSCINRICKDPCACGEHAFCRVIEHKPVCTCEDGYEGNPDVACIKIECRVDDDCLDTHACRNEKCRPVCGPGNAPCGGEAICTAISHEASCHCPAGLEGDPYVTCTEIDCRSDEDCPSDKACYNSHCISPCSIQNPCQAPAECTVVGHEVDCSCPPGFEGSKGTSCTKVQIGCRSDSECPSQTACINRECINPCSVADPCGRNAKCQVLDTLPVRTMVCVCITGYQGNAAIECTPVATCPSGRGLILDENEECVCPPGYYMDSEGVCIRCKTELGFVLIGNQCICDSSRGLVLSPDGQSCICPPDFEMGPDGVCIPILECTVDDECADPKYCELSNNTCSDPCVKWPCGPNAYGTPTGHRCICKCIEGYIGNPITGCRPPTTQPPLPGTFPRPDLQVNCLAEGILVRIDVVDNNFNGVMYVKGHSNDERCRKAVNVAELGSDIIDFRVQFGSCGLFHSDGEANFILVIQKHPKLVTFKSQAYRIRCVYNTGTQDISIGFNVSMLTTSGTIANTGPPPTCSMRICNSNGNDISSAEIGDNLMLKVDVQPNAIYGGFARRCVATTMGDDGENEYLVTDDNGCATDPSIFGEWQYERNLGVLTASFNAFKFPASNNIRFQCNIRVCFGQCQPQNCAGSNAYGRRRRDTGVEGTVFTGQLREEIMVQSNAILTIERRTESRIDPLTGSRGDEEVCVSKIGFIIALVITALLALVAVAIAVSCWLMAYRRRPKSAGPLPHPAEFPNPLFTTPTPPLQEPAPDYLS